MTAPAQRCQPKGDLVRRLRDDRAGIAVDIASALDDLCIEAADRIEELEEALRPFADEADTHADKIPDQMHIWDYEGPEGGRSNLRVGDLRRARAALSHVLGLARTAGDGK